MIDDVWLSVRKQSFSNLMTASGDSKIGRVPALEILRSISCSGIDKKDGLLTCECCFEFKIK